MIGSKRRSASGHVSLSVILCTALLAIVLAGAAAWYAGLLQPAGQKQQEDAATGGENIEYTCSMHPQVVQDEPGNCPICGMELVPRDRPEEAEKNGEREIAYWRAPMNPEEIYDQPGKSSMGMDLIPVYEDQLVAGVDISIDPVMEQNMGIRTETVQRGPLKHTIRTYGHVTYDETRMARINLRFNGWIQRLYVDFTGKHVQKGEPMFDFYSPELVTAQQELLEAQRNSRLRSGEPSRKMLETVKSRLHFYNISDSEIQRLLDREKIQPVLTIRSPFTGVVTEKNAQEGDFIQAGKTVYQIADLSRIWVEAHIFEYELGRVEKGQPAEMSLPYLPGEKYRGKVAYIYPYLQRKTRDVVVRLEFDNPDLFLKPDMYGDVRIKTGQGKHCIHVPRSAVLRSGERDIVFVRRAEGKFTPREIELGLPLDNDRYQVLKGLAPGEQVVTSGQFLLDSESRLREGSRKMTEPKETAEPEKAKQAGAEEGFFSDLENDAQEDDFFKDLE